MGSTPICAVIGQGYVGLPLSLELCKIGYKVFAVDIDAVRIGELKLGKTNVEGIDTNELRAQISNGRLMPTTDFNDVSGSEVIFLCVPTPLGTDRKPDLKILESASKSIAPFLTPGVIVITESTIEPGTTRNILTPIFEQGSGLNRDEIHIVFSPERIDPANEKWRIDNTPKLVAGLREESAQKAKDLYLNFITDVHVCSSLEVAETAKLLENTFRLINISFVNELMIFCEKIGIDINHVIEAAATKPYGFMPFYPSIGVGGHCIPVDPLYLADKARKSGAIQKMIELADDINLNMPNYFVERAEAKIGGLKEKKVLVVGVAYKPNVSDVRETPVKSLIKGLKQKGAQVYWHDDLVKDWNGEKTVTLSSDFDLAILATPHDYLDLTKLGNVPILNTRGSIQ